MSFSADAWANADTSSPTFEDEPKPDPGTFDAMLTNAQAWTSKQGNDTVKLSWEIMDAPQTGFRFDHINGFGSDIAYKITKQTCEALGADVTGVGGMDDLHDRLQPLIGGFYSLTVKMSNNPKYRNVFVNGKAAGSNGDAPARQSDIPVSDDDFALPGTGDTDVSKVPFLWDGPTGYVSSKSHAGRLMP